jgi:hypothetical protein
MTTTHVRGFTVVELLVSTAITLIVMGVALFVVAHARDALDRDGMGLESAQRLRAGFDVLTREVRGAGAGPEAEAAVVAFPHAFPVVELLAARMPGPGETARFGSIRVTAAPQGAAHGRLASGIVPGSSIGLRAPPDCPAVPVCGFSEGTAAVIYDGTGAFDRVVVTAVDPASWSLVVSPAVSRPYPADAVISEVIVSTFVVDIDSDGMGRLIRQTGGGAVQPVVDHVVRFGVEAYGEAAPPWPGRTPRSPPTYGPMPPPPDVDDPRDAWPPGENCTMALGANGLLTPRLPPLGGLGELIAIEPSMVQDGPWCAGPSGEAYDADLFRIRRVDLRLRVEASAARLRGPAGVLFARAGHGQGTSWSPDLELRVSVSPPNLGRR